MWQPQRHLDGDEIIFPLRPPAALEAQALEASFLAASSFEWEAAPGVEQSPLVLVRLGPDRG